MGLLTPIGLAIAALAGTAIALTLYWQPITAFLRRGVEECKQAAASIKAALSSLSGWLAEKGKQLGEGLSAGITSALTPLKRLMDGVSWLLEKLGVLEAKSARLPAVSAAQPALSRPKHYTDPLYHAYKQTYFGQYDQGGAIPRGKWGVVGEKGPEIVTGSAHILSRKKTAALAATAGMMLTGYQASAAPLHPQSLPAAAYRPRAATPSPYRHVTPVSIHAPIQIIAHAHHRPQDIAREVARQLDQRERQALAKINSRYQDSD